MPPIGEYAQYHATAQLLRGMTWYHLPLDSA